MHILIMCHFHAFCWQQQLIFSNICWPICGSVWISEKFRMKPRKGQKTYKKTSLKLTSGWSNFVLWPVFLLFRLPAGNLAGRWQHWPNKKNVLKNILSIGPAPEPAPHYCRGCFARASWAIQNVPESKMLDLQQLGQAFQAFQTKHGASVASTGGSQRDVV